MKSRRNRTAILGFDIGGTKTAVVVGTYEGKILKRLTFPTFRGKGFSACWSSIRKNGSAALRWAARNKVKVKAVSVSIGGPLDIERGIIYSPPNLPGWENIHLKDLLKESFSLPVFLEHDGNAGALGEYFFGAGRGHKNVVFLTLGTGLGAGIILDGRIYHGSSDNAGEVGHIRVARTGPMAYGKSGSWEGFCSGSGIAKLAHEMNPRRWKQNVQGSAIADAARSGNEEALRVIQKSAKFLGQGLAIVSDILNPEVIILGSLGVRIGDLLIEPALKEMKREATPRAFEVCQIVPAALGEHIGDVASLSAAIYHHRRA